MARCLCSAPLLGILEVEESYDSLRNPGEFQFGMFGSGSLLESGKVILGR